MVKVHAGIRVDPAVLVRIAAIAVELSKRAEGTEVTRADAARTVVMVGVETLEKRLGIAPPEGEKKEK